MTKRSRRLMKMTALAYGIALAAFIYTAGMGSREATRPRLIEEKLTILPRTQFTGWRAADRFEKMRTGIISAAYLMRAEHASLLVGQVIDEGALGKLMDANPGTVLVWNPRLCRDFAARELRCGEEVTDANGDILARVGDELDLERLIRLALAFDAEKGEAAHPMLLVQGTRRFSFLDLTSVFVGVNFLALTALMYVFLWEPTQRVLAERRQVIKTEVEKARRMRAEAVSERAKAPDTED